MKIRNSILKSPLAGGRRTDEERKVAKCAGEIDPITFEAINPAEAVRLYDNGKYFCFDAPALQEWFRSSNSFKNPFTHREFSDAQIEKFFKKLDKIHEANKLPDPVALSPEQVKQLLFNQINEWDRGLILPNEKSFRFLDLLFERYDELFGKNGAFYKDNELPVGVPGNGIRLPVTILALACLCGSYDLVRYFVDVKDCDPSALDVVASIVLQHRFNDSTFSPRSIQPLSFLISRNVQTYGVLQLQAEFQKYLRPLDKVKLKLIEAIDMSELRQAQKQELIRTFTFFQPPLSVRRPT